MPEKQPKDQTEQTFTLVKHYPVQPFGDHAGKYVIEIHGASNCGAASAPLSGCELNEQLDEAGKDLLCQLKLARLDLTRRFIVDFGALQGHLRNACGVSEADLPSLTWKSVVATIRGHHRA